MLNKGKAKNRKAIPLVTGEEQAQIKTPFTIVEAYKSIRVRLLADLSAINGNCFVVTSPFAADGKSTTAINLAITFSHLNKKILLIDADSRRSSIHKKLKMENDLGCMDILTGSAKFEDIIKPYNSYLDILTAGSTVANPSELFSSPEFSELLKEVKEKYEYVIIDTPPVNLVSDTLVIAQQTDGVVIIAKAKHTTYKAFKTTAESIKALDIRILGTIINGIDNGKNKYYKSKYGAYGKKNKYYYYSRY